jgi:hypothetical protein
MSCHRETGLEDGEMWRQVSSTLRVGHVSSGFGSHAIWSRHRNNFTWTGHGNCQFQQDAASQPLHSVPQPHKTGREQAQTSFATPKHCTRPAFARNDCPMAALAPLGWVWPVALPGGSPMSMAGRGR